MSSKNICFCGETRKYLYFWLKKKKKKNLSRALCTLSDLALVYTDRQHRLSNQVLVLLMREAILLFLPECSNKYLQSESHLNWKMQQNDGFPK